jgi:hypothetical protein
MSEVFVLGAGFTKAFLEDAPLLVDDYGGSDLLEKYAAFPHAQRILSEELSRQPEDLMDLERLMTRLDGGMPYDGAVGAKQEFALLNSELRSAFQSRLAQARQGVFHKEDMQQFAAHCKTNKVTCVTFNYDDVFDEYLWNHVWDSGWHPDGGYGFFCKPSTDCVREYGGYKDQTSMLLLKLHGSVNWRPRLGSKRPYGIDSIVHHANWFLEDDIYKDPIEDIERHLEKEPFLVPPVLVKSSLVEEPLLQAVWSMAYGELHSAERVTFIGYSMPITDIAARTLFRESISRTAEIKIVTRDASHIEDLLDSYKRVFSNVAASNFVFGGALDWSKSIIDSPTVS